MTMESNKSANEVWGQRFLMIAVVLNAAILVINLFLSSFESELARMRRDEQYQIANHQEISHETIKQIIRYTSLNQLSMLRRLAKPHLTPDETQALLRDEKELEHQIKVNFGLIVAETYLQANHSPNGPDPNKLFGRVAIKSLEDSLPIYQKQEIDFGMKLKTEMVQLMRKVSCWKIIQNIVTIANMIILLIGAYLMFSVGKSVKVEMPKTT